tara:strand:+ start:392 stop:577 length:186 start_codon:yes stop_codon:yes gene_type:complete
MSYQLIRIKQVAEITGLSNRTIYRWIKKGKFPKQINLGNSRIVAWNLAHIEKWIQQQPQIA